jgi:major membrane immunogen (membrane-anchored lipoprotein)
VKKILAVALLIGIAAGFAFAQADLSKVKDGVYFASESAFSKSGWKDQVTLTVAGGQITSVSWNGLGNLPGVMDKKTWAVDGKYGMKKASKLGTEWNQQAAAAEAWLLKTQDPGFSKFDKEGKTDAISGASMTTKGFLELVNKALSSAPIARGALKKDGYFYATEADFDKSTGWKDTAVVVVANGTIVDLLWNGIYKNNTKKSKLVEAETGKYGMAKAAKKGEWNVQAAAVQAAIIKAGDPAKISMKADGTSDAISGASIHLTVVAIATDAIKAIR